MIGQKLGNFELAEELGGGAWGKVYMAKQVSLGGRPVAVKVLRPHLAEDETPRQRFLAEAHNMARLNHPNICKVIDFGEEDGTYFFAMEYIRGETLASVTEREGALSPERTAELGAQVADALGYAHSQGVVHRDVKPGNIIIDEHGGALVTDFGIAKVGEGTGLTATGAAIGTPEYMSPEQAKGNPVDGRSDIYSLGVMLYHMITGQVPFSGTTPVATAMKHISDMPQDPQEVSLQCPKWLASIILRALAKEPVERFRSAAEMASALRNTRPVTPPTTEVPDANVGALAPEAQPRPATEESQERARSSSSDARRTAAIITVVAAIALTIGLLIPAVYLRSQTGHLGIPSGTPPVAPRQPTAPDIVVGSGQPSTAQVPSVVGLTQVDAEQRLKEYGNFLVRYSEPRHSDVYEAGRVISQSPEAGAVLASGDFVSLALSKGNRYATSSGTYLAPWTSHRRVTIADLTGKSNWTLTLMRNEIFARHGRSFVTPAIQDYFLRQPWYSIDADYSDTRLSQTEERNAVFIREFQKRQFGHTAKHP